MDHNRGSLSSAGHHGRASTEDLPSTMTVEGLQTQDTDAPLASRRRFCWTIIWLLAIGDPKDENLAPEEDFSQVFIDRNGPGSFTFPASHLPGADPNQVSGEEIFRLYALPDGEVAELQLSSAKVQVWPMATATFSGDFRLRRATPMRAEGDREFESNLYPDSETWVQYYQGPPSSRNHMAPGLTENVVILDQDVPRNAVMDFTKIGFDSVREWRMDFGSDYAHSLWYRANYSDIPYD